MLARNCASTPPLQPLTVLKESSCRRVARDRRAHNPHAASFNVNRTFAVTSKGASPASGARRFTGILLPSRGPGRPSQLGTRQGAAEEKRGGWLAGDLSVGRSLADGDAARIPRHCPFGRARRFREALGGGGVAGAVE
ncbi:unnamed protein product [Lampetra planeri]